MKEDYLWNKTGSDTGIEQLENALAQFRFNATEPPTLPAKILALPEKRSYGFFKLGLVFAVSLVVVGSIVWMRFTTINSSAGFGDSAKQSEVRDVPVSIPAVDSKPAIDSGPREKHFVRTVQPVRIAARPIRIVAGRSQIKTQPEKLTREEKYAYGQLMLALAITSNELKIVRDKINGREERNAADDRQK
ncbi:MAG: hypothetical protein ABI999_18440 [Acidobacteriota bacterium]